MSNNWRWDQGRLQYFLYSNLQAIAQSLCSIEGVEINQKTLDPLREVLENGTGLPFSPEDYKVWRNYKRVFECSMLATSINNRLHVSDIAKLIQNKEVDADEYFVFLISNFRYPFPAFVEYSSSEEIVYPFCAIIKYLIANYIAGKAVSISLEEVFSKIIGNGCNGMEDLNFYENLRTTTRTPKGDEQRQVREMLIFMSQLSILKWHKNQLWIDLALNEIDKNIMAFSPNILPIASSKEQDFINLSSLKNTNKLDKLQINTREAAIEDFFTEGKRIRVTHVKIERSPLLRKLFFEKNPKAICNMCEIDTKRRYPWASNLLEIHHVLPLSSTLIVTSSGTSLDDVVPLCPTCHRGVHSYYKVWLNSNNLVDFKNKNEALFVYKEAKNSLKI